MPRVRVPGEIGDKDSNAGALRAPECSRQRDDTGGRKLLPPMVRPVRHSGTPEGAERAAPGDRTVPKWSGKEEMTAGRDGDKGELGAGV